MEWCRASFVRVMRFEFDFDFFKVIIKRPTFELVHYLKETSR
jgi:hypothetical protein